jgi:hypothetical protein
MFLRHAETGRATAFPQPHARPIAVVNSTPALNRNSLPDTNCHS